MYYMSLARGYGSWQGIALPVQSYNLKLGPHSRQVGNGLRTLLEMLQYQRVIPAEIGS